LSSNGEEIKKKEILWGFWREKGYIQKRNLENENEEARQLHKKNIEKIEKKIEKLKKTENP
jgi:hypothetical protein